MVCHKAACSDRFSLIYTALILPIYSVTIQYMYADDTQLYVEFPNGPLEHSTSDAGRMSRCTTDVKTWLTQHKLALSDKKTEAIRITTVSTCHPRPAVIHVGALAVQSKQCYSVRHFRSPSPQTACLAELCCTVDNGTCRREHISPVLFALHWLPIRLRIKFKLLLLVYRCLHQLVPAYLSEFITPYTPARSLRSADSNLVTTNRYRLEGCGRRRFSVAGPFLWNQLTANVKSADSIGAFKTALKSHLFREAFMTLL